MNRVVATGLGIVSSIGLGHREYWRNLVAGRSGEALISSFDTDGFPVRIAAEVEQYPLEEHWPHEVPRQLLAERRTSFALTAAGMAIADSDLVPSDPACLRAPVVLGAGLGIVCLEDVVRFLDADADFDVARFANELSAVRPQSILRNSPDLVNGVIAEAHGFGGPSLTITSACAAGAQAIGLAYRMLRRGDAEVALCGAADSMINPVGLAGFILLGAVSTRNKPGRTSRPFDRSRSGLVIGEGAGMVVLETLERAQRRGARIYAEVRGYGTSLDACNLTSPHPEGRGAAQAMHQAIREAGLEPSAVDHVNAHGTSTALNDKTETLAIKKVFGDHAYDLAVTANKSMTGHAMAASGALEFVATCLTLFHQVVPPTINYTTPDPACDLDYVPNGSRPMDMQNAITNSFALGGQNASILLHRPPSAKRASSMGAA